MKEATQRSDSAQVLGGREFFEPGSGPRLLVLDDDPLFCRHFAAKAKHRGLMTASTCPDMNIESLPVDGYFDVILIDYDLGKYSGLKIASMFAETPILLISGSRRAQSEVEKWPHSITEFCSKQMGVDEIIDHAIDVWRR